MTFHEDILNGFQVTQLQSGRHCILFLTKPFFVQRAITNIYIYIYIYIYPRVMVLAICTSSNVG